jgi:DNA-binding LacI/PurR family transcriptional regulator
VRTQRITQRDVARQAGVSQRLVSAVLHNNAPNIRVGAETRERIRRAAAELGYRPNVVARSLVARKTHTLGLVIGNLTNPVYGELTNSVHWAAAARGYDVMIALSEGWFEQQSHGVEKLLERRVDGLLLWTDYGHEEEEALSRLRSEGPPLVVVGIELPDEMTSYVAVDRTAGVAEAVAHLVRLGHTRIGYVGYDARPELQVRYATKFRGFVQGLAEHGLSPDRVWSFDRLPGRADHRPLWQSLAEEIARVPDLPSALIVGGDALALALLASFARAGIRVPDDVALIGYDDVPTAVMSIPALTTIAQPTRALAEEAVSCLLERIDDPDAAPCRTLLRPRLVVRESCGARQAPPVASPGVVRLREETVGKAPAPSRDEMPLFSCGGRKSDLGGEINC